MYLAPIRGLIVLMLASILAASCNNPETQKLQHVKRGDEYVKEKRDEFAVVEYASAVKIDPKFGEARLKLAQTYERMQNIKAALPEFIRAADALPDNRDVQVKATALLLLSRQFDDAKARAEAMLVKNPKDVDALLLRANAMAALRDSAGAVAEIEEAIKISPDTSSRALVSLGTVQTQTGDKKEAEAAFREAIKVDRSSLDAKLALANFLLGSQRVAEVEPILKDVLAQEPKNLLANRMLAALYISSNRVAEAEQPLKNAAEIASAPQARLQLADYYAIIGRTSDAVVLLNALAKEPATFGEAELRLCAFDYAQNRVTEAHSRLDALLTRAPNFSEALVLKAQWLTKENKLDDAFVRAKAAVSADPQSASAQFALGVVHERRRETADAIKSYQEALRLNPRAAAAQVQLSRLSLVAGNSAGAQRFAEEAREAEPSNLDARVALVRSLIAAGNSTRAQTELASLLRDAPNAAVVHAVNGLQQARANNLKGARAAYERALELSPGLLEAVGGLVYLDLMAKDTTAASNRVNAELAKQPANAALFTLLARVHNAAGDRTKEEQALRSAVTVDPRFTTGYALLAQLYQQQKRIDEARAEFEGMAKRDPSNVAAQTMVGTLLDQQGKRDEAIKAYEAALSGTANAPVAANNLAFIYAERGTNLDVALQLATSAKQRMPNEPSFDDTLGWVYYKKGMIDLAVKSLEESVSKRQDPEVLFHLGLAYAKAGEKEKAREALQLALKLNPKVGGDEARQALESVSR
jgi:tetratricopeptide (TPR) repeat protein